MKTRFLTLCKDYQAFPELFIVHDESQLQHRYNHLQLRDSSELRLSNLCVIEDTKNPATTQVSGGSR